MTPEFRSALEEIKARLVRLRSAKGWLSGPELANQTGIPRGTLERMFTGSVFPSWSNVAAVVDALDGDRGEFQRLWETAASLRRSGRPRTSQTESVDIAFYDSTDDFYEALTESVSAATKTLSLTYIRQSAPDTYRSTAAQTYFRTVLEWAESGRPVRRVIGVPTYDRKPDPRFVEWLQKHLREIEQLGIGNVYNVHLFEWAGGTDLRNIALVDDDIVYETWSGRTNQEIFGHRVVDRRYAEGFHSAFEGLFSHNHTNRLDLYLGKLSPSP